MKQPLWISHRGLCEEATENTLEAFQNAREAGFTHIETDLRMTRDGHIVFSHDRDLRRLAGQDTILARSDRATLEKIRLPDGSRLLFWEEWAQDYKKTAWTFDLKKESALAVIDFLENWMKREKTKDFFREKVRFVCWSRAHEQALLARIPFAQCYARRFECYQAGIACLLGLSPLAGLIPGRVYALPARLGGLSLFQKKILQRYQQRGAEVVAFLPRPGKETEKAVAVGCDEILTNHRPLSLDNLSAQ
ncbi:MAG: hypothetical protein JJT75_13705 [Opitutales bacterium]|nr:hypothetical protein [Opitutales bacterium]MCH8540477.1 hypothetical protein [Opitutales bacterium]